MRRLLDRLWGRGDFAVTLPAMDGALRPNTALESAPELLRRDDVDDVAVWNGAPVVSCGSQVIGLDGAVRGQFEAPVLAMTGLRDGRLAVALANGQIAVEDQRLPAPGACVTALCEVEPGVLAVALGSDHNGPDAWRRDLLEKRRSGSVWRVPLTGPPERVIDGLGWASGVAVLDGRLLISDAWRARIVDADGARFIDHLPAYPGRLCPDQQGTLWACLFAPRRQLLEFVLREDAYRTAMLAEVPEPHWIAPTLRNGQSFLEPLQAGGVKQLGVLKPWAPSMSYGLVVRLDGQGRPVHSLHSRADGQRHGVTGCLADGDGVIFVARGDGIVARAGGLI